MTTRGVVDIVFCLDASESMRPCFEAVSRHISDFIAGLESNRQVQWDWRLDFVAHSAGAPRAAGQGRMQRALGQQGQGQGQTPGQGRRPEELLFSARSVHCAGGELIDALYRTGGGDAPGAAPGQGNAQAGSRFFTRDLGAFRRALAGACIEGDEAPLIALDLCLDFPWRPAGECHRVVVMMTDEPFETGVAVEAQRARLEALIRKTMALRVMLFIVAPASEGFDALAAADRSEYQVVEGQNDGLRRVDFRQVLAYVGKSVSVSVPGQGRAEPVARGLFDQAAWGSVAARLTGR